MTFSNTRQDEIRAPKQARSQQRVERILEATEALVLEKGCAGFSMTDIAQRAEVTIGSIYQYFPKKAAIIAALAKHYLDAYHLTITAALEPPPQTLDALSQTTTMLFEGYYTLHRENPVVRDIWMGSAADKEFRDIDAADTQKNVELMFERSKHLFRKRDHAKVRLLLLLHISFSATAVATAVELDEREARKVMDMATSMLYASWDATMKPLARHGR